MQFKNIKYIKSVFPAVVLSILFYSCGTTRSYTRPEGITDGIYRGYEGQDTTTIASLSWKELFTDTILQRLIQEGIDNNYDMQIATARIKQANANFKQSKSVLFPTLSANADITLQTKGNEGTWNESYSLSASSRWEIDVWGKLRSAKRASLNVLLESEAYKRSVQTQVLADIASYYYKLQVLDAQLKVVEQTLKTRKEDVEAMKVLKEANVVTGAAVVQSEANRYSSEVTLLELKQSIWEIENSMCILLGRAPGNVQRADLTKQNPGIDLKIGIPAQLLAYRPDVQEAEFALRYYAELTNVARAYFYPAISITAEGGLTNADISKLFDPSSVFANVVGGLTSPVFNQRANRQRLEVAKAKQEEYLAAFKSKVLNAGKEVSNALYDYKAAGDRIEMRKQQIFYLEKSVEYTKELLRNTSNTNYTDVLTSEQGLLSAQLNKISDEQQQLLSIVELYRSLGGGWR